MISDMPNMGFGDKAAKARSLKMKMAFAPSGFLEMFGGTFMLWFIVWRIIYKVADK